ncbi:hypothetical protein H4R21_006175 [Coemansia helicoidea]|uniref:Uncharacterized protein n=2 Tax=Coemansia TaxID=4863 RepID=A0ACC1KP85_9FUNG|nr:hypothetical protein H4R21_006175 [Coemansia helicoidea]
MRLQLSGSISRAGGRGRHAEVESNPDTIISDQASATGHTADEESSRPLRSDGAMAGYSMAGPAAGPRSPTKAVLAMSRFGGVMRVFGRGRASAYHKSEDDGMETDSRCESKPTNHAALALGGATIGNLPQRRNSRGEDIMVISHIPPFTPVRYTIMATLLQTPAGMARQANMNTFRTLPFALRGDYYGFYSTFIADGATLQINVEGRISEAITRLIHSQQYTVDMMDEAHTEVLQLLYDNIFKKFVRIYHRDMAHIM